MNLPQKLYGFTWFFVNNSQTLHFIEKFMIIKTKVYKETKKLSYYGY